MFNINLVFFSGPEGYFYTETIAEGEKILSLMNVDSEEWTATQLGEYTSTN